MPAGSENPPVLPTLPHTWRPFGPRIAGWIFALVLVAAFGWLWISFPPQTKEAINGLQRATVVFFVLVGVVLLNGMARSRVSLDDTTLTLVNGYRKHVYERAQVVAFHMPPGAPWPKVDLSDGSTVSALGIHGSDGARARTAVREIQALLDT